MFAWYQVQLWLLVLPWALIGVAATAGFLAAARMSDSALNDAREALRHYEGFNRRDKSGRFVGKKGDRK